jgi:hypothetical protein
MPVFGGFGKTSVASATLHVDVHEPEHAVRAPRRPVIVAGVALGIVRLDRGRALHRHANGPVRIPVAVRIEERTGVAGVVPVPHRIVEIPREATAAGVDAAGLVERLAELLQVLLPRLVVRSLLIIGARGLCMAERRRERQKDGRKREAEQILARCRRHDVSPL